jgi:hypothetical protein
MEGRRFSVTLRLEVVVDGMALEEGGNYQSFIIPSWSRVISLICNIVQLRCSKRSFVGGNRRLRWGTRTINLQSKLTGRFVVSGR